MFLFNKIKGSYYNLLQLVQFDYSPEYPVVVCRFTNGNRVDVYFEDTPEGLKDSADFVGVLVNMSVAQVTCAWNTTEWSIV